ncbi:MAG: hypothetical protein HY897_04455 [Deltaproteobacteria bacterium]|nr:hypothetical protein [Deltaproteobacteria bacterium]
MKRFTIEYQYLTLEPFHTGSGVGKAGEYDAGQRWEEVGGYRVPIVPDDTVKGLLRESARRLCDSPHYTLGDGADKKKLFHVLFEFAEGDSLFVSSLRPTVAGDDLFIVHNQTAVDPETGRAKQHSLRNIQCGVDGITLHGTVSARCRDDKVAESARRFIEDALKNLRELGGHRRRGLGAVRLQLPLKDILEAHRLVLPDAKQNSSAIRLRLCWEACEAVCFTVGSQAGNLLRTHPFIPGSTILGMLRHEYIWLSDAAKQQKACALISEDSPLVVSNGYPLPPGCTDLLPSTLPVPVPLSVQYPKGGKGA